MATAMRSSYNDSNSFLYEISEHIVSSPALFKDVQISSDYNGIRLTSTDAIYYKEEEIEIESITLFLEHDGILIANISPVHALLCCGDTLCLSNFSMLLALNNKNSQRLIVSILMI